MAKFVILVEKKLPMRRKNMARYHPNNSNNNEYEDNDDEDEHYENKTKKKSKKMNINTIREGLYCQNCFNEGDFTMECKLLLKFCRICKVSDHNPNQFPNKAMSGSCPSREIILVYIVQAKIQMAQKQKKCQIIVCQMIKINIIIDNIMQDPMVVIGKTIISQIGIIDITNNDIIKILDFDKNMSNVVVVGRKVMSRTIVMYGRKLLKKKKGTLN
jgi:hypothetical protein